MTIQTIACPPIPGAIYVDRRRTYEVVDTDGDCVRYVLDGERSTRHVLCLRLDRWAEVTRDARRRPAEEAMPVAQRSRLARDRSRGWGVPC